MKKLVIVLALVALVLVPVAAAKNVAAIGLELGLPTGITFDYKLDNKWDGYTTIAFGFGSVSYIDAVIGGQYKFSDFKIDKMQWDLNAGLQVGVNLWLGDNNGLGLAFRGTVSASHDWTWKDVGDFTIYLRGGIGYAVALSGNFTGGISPCLALGLVYHL